MLILRCGQTKDRLDYAPAGALPSALVTQLREHKTEVIRILREDEEYRRTGILQSERQVFDVVREHFSKDGKNAT